MRDAGLPDEFMLQARSAQDGSDLVVNAIGWATATMRAARYQEYVVADKTSTQYAPDGFPLLAARDERAAVDTRAGVSRRIANAVGAEARTTINQVGKFVASGGVDLGDLADAVFQDPSLPADKDLVSLYQQHGLAHRAVVVAEERIGLPFPETRAADRMQTSRSLGAAIMARGLAIEYADGEPFSLTGAVLGPIAVNLMKYVDLDGAPLSVQAAIGQRQQISSRTGAQLPAAREDDVLDSGLNPNGPGSKILDAATVLIAYEAMNNGQIFSDPNSAHLEPYARVIEAAAVSALTDLQSLGFPLQRDGGNQLAASL